MERLVALLVVVRWHQSSHSLCQGGAVAGWSHLPELDRLAAVQLWTQVMHSSVRYLGLVCLVCLLSQVRRRCSDSHSLSRQRQGARLQRCDQGFAPVQCAAVRLSAQCLVVLEQVLVVVSWNAIPQSQGSVVADSRWSVLRCAS